MRIVRGSILDFEGDAIVNPANSFLNHAGGLAGVIARVAMGPLHDCIEYAYSGSGPVSDYDAVGRSWAAEQRGRLVAVGDAVLTSAGHLPFKGIIHAVGPIWGGGHFCERELLDSAYAEACAVALSNDFERVAFPAISCGIFGFPVSIAAPIAVRALLSAEQHILGIETSVYLLEEEHVKAFTLALERAL